VNLERIKERSELFNPDAKVGTSERISTLKTVGASGGPRGVAGTKSNVSGGNTATAGAGGGGTSVQEKTDTDYAVSRTLRELEKRNNIIERMTVAALLDLSGQGENTPKLTLADATKLIKSAIGFKEGRDDIQVSDVRLLSEQEGPEVDPAVQERMESLLFAIRTASLVVGLLLLVLLAILVASRKRREKKAKLEAAAQVPPAPPILPQEADEFRNLVQADPERVARMLTQLLEGTS
jgi:flagellar M-ring protein FliF